MLKAYLSPCSHSADLRERDTSASRVARTILLAPGAGETDAAHTPEDPNNL